MRLSVSAVQGNRLA